MIKEHSWGCATIEGAFGTECNCDGVMPVDVSGDNLKGVEPVKEELIDTSKQIVYDWGFR